MPISDFIARCDAFCEARGLSRVWLSKRLFNDTFKIENLDVGATDIGVRRLAKADADLTALEKGVVHGGGSVKVRNMAPADGCGAENPERNVSRTDEPGSSPSTTTLDDAGMAHPVGQADAVEGAAGNNAVVAAAPRAALDPSAHGDVDQLGASVAPAGFGQFGGAEVLYANLDPAVASASANGLDTQAVTIADIDDRTGEGRAARQFRRHRSPVGDVFAGIRQDGRGDEADGGEHNDSKHGASVAAEPYRGVSA